MFGSFIPIKPYYNFDSYIFSSEKEKKETQKILFGNHPYVFIISRGGMGGSHLLSACRNYYAEKYNTAEPDVCELFLNIRKFGFSLKNQLFSYDILFIDGFQRMADDAKAVFQSFAREFVNKGGRFFLKANPSEGLNEFKNFAAEPGYGEVHLCKTPKVIISKMLNTYEFENSHKIKKSIKRILASLHYTNYRTFQGVLLMLHCYSLQYSVRPNKFLAIKAWKQVEILKTH